MFKTILHRKKLNRIKSYLIALFIIISISISPILSYSEVPISYSVEYKEGSIIIKTPDMVVLLESAKPEILYWGNVDPNHVFRVSFNYLIELVGDDLIVDKLSEILGGKVINLVSDLVPWEYTIEECCEKITVTLGADSILSFLFL
jgi:hypothetical protein